MLASPWDEAFRDPGWAFELKWDGIRAVILADERGLRVHSRAGNDLTAGYPELGSWSPGRPMVIDGEIVAFDALGRPSFEALQQRMNLTGAAGSAVVPISVAVFDVLHDGETLTHRTWKERREILDGLELPEPYLRSEVAYGDGTALWELVVARDLEGIVAKRIGSQYHPGVRSPEWRKIARFRHVRAVVAGYVPGERARSRTFGSLLLGLHTADGLRWIGAVGSGFTDPQLTSIRQALDSMTTPQRPFLADPSIPRNAVWVHPQLVAMVRFKEFTSAGRLRGPSFKGFTDDDPASITWAAEGPQAR
jgi:bifunctional non-homologous end joining protein LigD